METMKKGTEVGNKVVYDMGKSYGRLLVLSQRSDMSMEKSIVVFARYVEEPTETHECLRRTGISVYTKLNLALGTILPATDSILKGEYNKTEIIKVFCSGNISRKV